MVTLLYLNTADKALIMYLYVCFAIWVLHSVYKSDKAKSKAKSYPNSKDIIPVVIKPTNNIKVYIDGDQGVSVDKLVSYNRKFYRQLEEEALFPDGDFSLELSSPGLDEPLKLHRQYVKNVGRPVEVVLEDGIKEEGDLKAVHETELELEVTKGKGKKAVVSLLTIPLSSIKTTKVQIKF